MKFIFLILFAFPSIACSELGPMELKVKPESLMKCGKLATGYAVDLVLQGDSCRIQSIQKFMCDF